MGRKKSKAAVPVARPPGSDGLALFHRNVAELVQKSSGPYPTPSYGGVRRQQQSAGHVLSLEEEVHLAGSFAFLAQAEAGSYAVSAVTVEETRGPASLTVRLAANRTPSVAVGEGLRGILEVLRKFARSNQNRNGHLEEVFDKVVVLSENRIYGRLGSKHWKRADKNMSGCAPLHKDLDRLLKTLQNQPPTPGVGLKAVRRKLSGLATSIQALEAANKHEHTERLKAIVLSAFAISTTDNSPTLAHLLQRAGCSASIYAGSSVLQVDKLSKYRGLCIDLLGFCEQEHLRRLFETIKLVTLTAPPEFLPGGARASCRVHGEVQLVMHYERGEPMNAPPRAIGSSKDPCFLCALFLQKHGRFQVESSHGLLYEPWTFPRDLNSLREDRRVSFDVLVREMSGDLAALLQKEMKGKGKGKGLTRPQSMVRLVLWANRTGLVSQVAGAASVVGTLPSAASGVVVQSPQVGKVTRAKKKIVTPLVTVVEIPDPDPLATQEETKHTSPQAEASREEEPQLIVTPIPEPSPPTSPKEGHLPSPPLSTPPTPVPSIKPPPSPTSYLFAYQDLPLTLPVTPDTSACTLLVGAVDYFFDLEEVGWGKLTISEGEGEGIDVRKLKSEEKEVSGDNGKGERRVVVCVNDEGSYGLRMEFVWGV